MSVMNENEIIQNGIDAKALLESNGFNRLYSVMQTELANQILATPVNAGETREQLYYTYQGMRSFAAALVTMVSAMENVLEMREADNAQEDESR